jgi:hypothetical protein
MNWNAIERTATPIPAMLATPVDEIEKPVTVREAGRRTILLGWLVTMIGIIGYVVALSRAPENADMLDAIASQGLVGWGSVLVLIIGVLVWAIGNVSMLHELSETPRSIDEADE